MTHAISSVSAANAFAQFPGLKDFTESYIEAMYWADTGEEGQPNSDAVLSAALQITTLADCIAFWSRNACCINATKASPSQAGHDFWLTRNGHGAGFWDRPETYKSETGAFYGAMLTDAAERAGPVEIYAGDDGAIYA
ncbi:hypothetical protein PhaeoP66_03220 [Phaeobacter inhibens]|uniref:Uncharacterized protein n=1 Tax=Phaeobacter inhibens TaxID=221822 RepID=A0ABM6RHP3_9RHOB|nr:hypothetical protein [Phaeobacter inhibens]AUQ95962.1 hypothetical protein PhaeoP66_03220 [Phaeobacter inhibens]